MVDQDSLTDECQLIVFELGGDAYGVDISNVREISRLQKVLPFEDAIDPFSGAMRVRSDLVPVLDLHALLGTAVDEPAVDQRVVVVEIFDYPVGMVVDAIVEVCRVPGFEVDFPSQEPAVDDEEYSTGRVLAGDRQIKLLDVESLVSADEIGDALSLAESLERAA